MQNFAAFQHAQLDTCSCQTNFRSQINTHKPALDGSASCVPPATGTKEDIKPTDQPCRAGSRLRWADLPLLRAQGNQGGPALGGPGVEWWPCPRVPQGQEPLKGTAPAGHEETAGHVWHVTTEQLLLFLTKPTNDRTFPHFIRDAVLKKMKLDYQFTDTAGHGLILKTNNFHYMKCIIYIYIYEIHTPSYARFNSFLIDLKSNIVTRLKHELKCHFLVLNCTTLPVFACCQRPF